MCCGGVGRGTKSPDAGPTRRPGDQNSCRGRDVATAPTPTPVSPFHPCHQNCGSSVPGGSGSPGEGAEGANRHLRRSLSQLDYAAISVPQDGGILHGGRPSGNSGRTGREVMLPQHIGVVAERLLPGRCKEVPMSEQPFRFLHCRRFSVGPTAAWSDRHPGSAPRHLDRQRLPCGGARYSTRRFRSRSHLYVLAATC